MCCVVTVGLLSNQSHKGSSAFDFSGQTQACRFRSVVHVCVCVSGFGGGDGGWTGKCICSFLKSSQRKKMNACHNK